MEVSIASGAHYATTSLHEAVATSSTTILVATFVHVSNVGVPAHFGVVEHFVDELLSCVTIDGGIPAAGNESCSGISNTTNDNDMGTAKYSLRRDTFNLQDVFPRINVITTTWSKKNILSQSIQSPSSIEHLKRLLIQTTFM